ncbi:hypothetical protein FRC04_006714 [Tulasnella sp. 424]|nr:hypothetical protein FRC04_006714 [Tulasnella sp. 424]KAG8960645.1 hypothetical protein FRC05_006703 [Tulasnella sp. 425]
MAGIVWGLFDFRHNRKYTMVGFCSGTIAGLVAATPSSGMIPPWASVILGIIAGVCYDYATKIKHWARIDDALDLFGEYGVTGIIGLLFNSIFAADYIISLDEVNTSVPGGFMQRNFKQLYIQFTYVCACCAYVFVVAALIRKARDMVPGLSLHRSDEAEIVGMDEHDIGEFVQDFVEARRALDAWNTPSETAEEKEAMKEDIVAAGDRHGGYTDVLAYGGHSLSRTPSRVQTAVPSDNEKKLANGAKVEVYAAGDLISNLKIWNLGLSQLQHLLRTPAIQLSSDLATLGLKGLLGNKKNSEGFLQGSQRLEDVAVHQFNFKLSEPPLISLSTIPSQSP